MERKIKRLLSQSPQIEIPGDLGNEILTSLKLPVSRRSNRRVVFPYRLVIAGSAAGAAVILAFVVTLLSPTTSAWSQALEALHNFDTMVMKFKTIAPNDQPQDLGNGRTYTLISPLSGVAYARRTDGKMAVYADREEGQQTIWYDGKKITSYVAHVNTVITMEPVTESGDAPPYVEVFATFNEFMSKFHSANEQDHGIVEYEGKKYRKIELTYKSNDRPEKDVFYLDPKSKRPAIMIQYLKNTHTGEMLPAVRIDYQFGVPIKDSHFTPDYPEDSQIIDQGKFTIRLAPEVPNRPEAE